MSVMTFCCVMMRMNDSIGPPPCCVPVAMSRTNWPKKPSTIAEIDAIRATGPDKNVLNVTPKAGDQQHLQPDAQIGLGRNSISNEASPGRR